MDQAQTKLQVTFNQVTAFFLLYGGRILLAVITLIVGASTTCAFGPIAVITGTRIITGSIT